MKRKIFIIPHIYFFMLQFIVAQSVDIDPASTAQYCSNYHRAACKASGKRDGFRYNGQSRSALFEGGQTSEFQIVVYKGNDYRIALCNDNNLGQLRMRIIAVKRVPVKQEVYEQVKNEYGEVEEKAVTETTYKREREVIYDNSQDSYATEVTFSVETSQKLIIEITAEGGTGELGCVGVLIEHMPTPKKGF